MIDLHTHSSVSDGSDLPARIPELAAAAGCRAVALTDHDRLDGLAEAGRRAAELGIELVPGCELSCHHDATMHVLVYFVEAGEGPLQEELIGLQKARTNRNRKLADLLGLDLDEVAAHAGGEGVGRPHFAQVLVDHGRATTIQDAFDRFLAKGQAGYIEKDRLTPERALALAIASNGLPVLAHPLSLGLEPAALDRQVGQLVQLGLAGIEATYGRYRPDERAELVDLAARHGIVATGGSDHHGTFKPDLQVGIGRGDLDVPDAALEQLKARRQ